MPMCKTNEYTCEHTHTRPWLSQFVCGDLGQYDRWISMVLPSLAQNNLFKG